MFCSICHDNNVEFIDKIKTELIINGYRDLYAIDVSGYFINLQHVEIYKCKKTGYKFYYPDIIAGNGSFYEKLQDYDWYYQADKWEHRLTQKLINPGDKVLEIGCGAGYFLQLIKTKAKEVVGLELNESAVKKGKDNHLTIVSQTVQQHMQDKKEYYDLVCSFQVMEHISDIKAVLNASIEILKPNGTLVICVPNNKSFIKKDKRNFLNMPPHHMGLWDNDSLTALTSIFPLKLENIKYERLYRNHFSWYYIALLSSIKNNSILSKGLRNRPFYKIFMAWLLMFSRFYKGHSILAVYKKV